MTQIIGYANPDGSGKGNYAKKVTQHDRILALLRDRGRDGVTALDALDEAGVFRLAARVGELKAEGYRIVTHTAVTSGGARIARYVLQEQMTAFLDGALWDRYEAGDR